MNQPLIDETKRDADTLAKLFTDMADAIKKNGDNSFGGAFVIVPPANGLSPIQTLILDSAQDPAQFWGVLKSKADIALASLDNISRNQRGFGR
jgi:hypothetical protein